MDLTVASLLAEVPDLADHETRRLLLLAANADAAWMVGNPDVEQAVAYRFRRLVARRRGGEPLQYIEGMVQFGPIELAIDARALIPRPETERLWEIGVEEISSIDKPVVVDLCTGSGNLALAIENARDDAEVYGTDISAAALALATENALLLKSNVSLFASDLFERLPRRLRSNVDLVVSNPPYVSDSEVDGLPNEVSEFEPPGALVAGPRGTEVLGRIAAEVGEWLRPGGVIVCEIGETQGDECLQLFEAFDPRIELDLAHRPRFVVGCAPKRRDVH